MPYVNIKITQEPVSAEQKARLISGVTQLLVDILGKNPATTHIVIEEVALENWGIGGLPALEYRASQKAAAKGNTA